MKNLIILLSLVVAGVVLISFNNIILGAIGVALFVASMPFAKKFAKEVDEA